VDHDVHAGEAGGDLRLVGVEEVEDFDALDPPAGAIRVANVDHAEVVAFPEGRQELAGDVARSAGE
jgi:hypothetical protein